MEDDLFTGIEEDLLSDMEENLLSDLFFFGRISVIRQKHTWSGGRWSDSS